MNEYCIFYLTVEQNDPSDAEVAFAKAINMKSALDKFLEEHAGDDIEVIKIEIMF